MNILAEENGLAREKFVGAILDRAAEGAEVEDGPRSLEVEVSHVGAERREKLIVR